MSDDISAGEQVVFFNNHGEVDENCVCEVIEVIGKHMRIKKPSGEIIRIYSNRISLASSVEQKPKESAVAMPDEFDPLKDLPDGHEVWIKCNTFSNTTICRTYAIIDPKGDKYVSVNTYDGKAPKKMTYNMASYDALINKLQKEVTNADNTAPQRGMNEYRSACPMHWHSTQGTNVSFY